MTRGLITVVASVCLVAIRPSIAAAQAPAPGQPPGVPRQPGSTSRSESGTIRGRIFGADTGKPLRRVRVTLLPVGQGVGQLQIAASANSQGQYELKEVPPGTYRVSAARAGYVATQYGQRLSAQIGQTIEVRGGQIVERIDMSLPRGGIVAGRIVDELGEPFPGVRVELLDIRYNDGRRVAFPAGAANTDDLGQFRLSGLRAGSYYLLASSKETWLGEKKEAHGYAATYFPGGPADQAQIISLQASQQRTHLDFTLAVSRTARISGVVQGGATGGPAEAQTVVLTQEYPGSNVVSSAASSTTTARDGSFEFRNVAPGNYLLQSRAGQSLSGQDEVAAFHLNVTGDDIEGLVLQRRTGSTVSGSIMTEDGTPPDFPPTRLRMDPVATDPDKRLPTSVYMPLRAVKPDWSFGIPNIAGPYVIRVTGVPDDWMVKAVRIQDRDVTDTPTDVPTGSREIAGVEVVLTRKTAAVSGSVVDRDGKATTDATVVVFADDPDRWGLGTRFVKMTRPGGDGHFSISGLPDGVYRVMASETIVDGQWEDTEFLASVHDEATRVVLSEGTMWTITLRMTASR